VNLYSVQCYTLHWTENSSSRDTASLPVEVESDQESWCCVRCTFLNHPALDSCQCCSFERSSKPGEQLDPLNTLMLQLRVIRLHRIPMVKTIVFANIIIFFLSHFLSSQTKFSGRTRNLYRYGPQVDLRTLTQFQ